MADAVLIGLPSIAALRGSARADTFGELRTWAQAAARRQAFGEAGRQLSREHRHAVLHFLWQESQSGLRAARARELLKSLGGDQDFAVPDEDQAWRPELAAAPEPASEEAEAGVPLADEPPEGTGLPSLALLRDPSADDRAVFQKLRPWLRDLQARGCLDQGAAQLSPEYRAAVFDYLCAFVKRQTVFQRQALDWLARLANSDAWCHRADGWRRGGVVDRRAVRALLEEHGVEAVRDWNGRLPSLEEFEAGNLDAEDTLAQLRVWVDNGKASGKLAMQVAELEERHFQAVMRFVCGPVAVATRPPAFSRSGSKLLASLRRPASCKALPKPGAALSQDTLVDRQHILEALAELDSWAGLVGDVDLSAVSRALARKSAA